MLCRIELPMLTKTPLTNMRFGNDGGGGRSSRETVTALIGDEAERVAFVNCALEPGSLDAELPMLRVELEAAGTDPTRIRAALARFAVRFPLPPRLHDARPAQYIHMCKCLLMLSAYRID